MNDKTILPEDFSALRRQAEERLRENRGAPALLEKVEDPLRFLHELQVYQIELEMQNEELRQARSRIETMLENYSDLFDFAPVAYCVLDPMGTIRTANLAASSLLGIERSQMTGRKFERFVSVDFQSDFSGFLAKVFSSPVKESCEMSLMNGNTRLNVQIEALAAASGEECRIAVIDLTEHKLMEELRRSEADLAARTAELESSNRELEAFNYMASHDLCQPLNNICTSAQAIELLCSSKLGEECGNFLQIIKKTSLNMRNLIGMFLRFSQSEHVELHNKIGDLSEMARVITANLRLSDPGRRVTFKIEEGMKAYGDPELLRVVLENIIGNAWKYTTNREQAIIEFGATEADGGKTYFIRDNGPGFDMHEADKLFQPFKRLNGVEEFTGHGIGLATVERIIRRHNGKIWAMGEPGKGATFFFTLGE